MPVKAVEENLDGDRDKSQRDENCASKGMGIDTKTGDWSLWTWCSQIVFYTTSRARLLFESSEEKRYTSSCHFHVALSRNSRWLVHTPSWDVVLFTNTVPSGSRPAWHGTQSIDIFHPYYAASPLGPVSINSPSDAMTVAFVIHAEFEIFLLVSGSHAGYLVHC